MISKGHHFVLIATTDFNRYLSCSAAASFKGYNNKDHASQAEALAKKFDGIPFVEETFTELAKPTSK